MTPLVVALALAASVTHATWNALLRSGTDRFATMAIMCATIAGVAAPCCLLLPTPPSAASRYVVASAVLQVGYSLFLVAAYRDGSLSHVFPVTRGTVPLLVTAGGLVLGQPVTAPAVVGVCLVSAGIVMLAAVGGRPPMRATVLAVITGMVIAGYNLIDARGVRVAGDPFSYAAWTCMIYGAFVCLAFGVVRRPALRRGLPARARQTGARQRGARQTGAAVTAGALTLLAYVLAVWAFSLGPAGPITALRETSVVVAAVIGHRFLGERLTPPRVLASLLVVTGAVLLS